MRKMNRCPLLRIGMTVAVSLVACIVASGQDARHNPMPGVDFSKYHTYKWVSIEDGAHPNQIVDAEIKQSVDTELASKGLTKRGFGDGMGSATQSTINVGSLVLDMYDPTTKQLVWTGSATKTIDPRSNQEKNQKNLNNAMQKLLKYYPPK